MSVLLPMVKLPRQTSGYHSPKSPSGRNVQYVYQYIHCLCAAHDYSRIMYVSTGLLVKLGNCFNLCLDTPEEVILCVLGFPTKRPSSIATAPRVASEIDRALLPSINVRYHDARHSPRGICPGLLL